MSTTAPSPLQRESEEDEFLPPFRLHRHQRRASNVDDDEASTSTSHQPPLPPPPRLDVDVHDDVLITILSLLSVEDVAAASRSSPTLERLARSPCLWRRTTDVETTTRKKEEGESSSSSGSSSSSEGEEDETSDSDSDGDNEQRDPSDLCSALSAAAALALRVPPRAAPLLLTTRFALYPRSEMGPTAEFSVQPHAPSLRLASRALAAEAAEGLKKLSVVYSKRKENTKKATFSLFPVADAEARGAAVRVALDPSFAAGAARRSGKRCGWVENPASISAVPGEGAEEQEEETEEQEQQQQQQQPRQSLHRQRRSRPRVRPVELGRWSAVMHDWTDEQGALHSRARRRAAAAELAFQEQEKRNRRRRRRRQRKESKEGDKRLRPDFISFSSGFSSSAFLSGGGGSGSGSGGVAEARDEARRRFAAAVAAAAPNNQNQNRNFALAPWPLVLAASPEGLEAVAEREVAALLREDDDDRRRARDASLASSAADTSAPKAETSAPIGDDGGGDENDIGTLQVLKLFADDSSSSTPSTCPPPASFFSAAAVCSLALVGPKLEAAGPGASACFGGSPAAAVRDAATVIVELEALRRKWQGKERSDRGHDVLTSTDAAVAALACSLRSTVAHVSRGGDGGSSVSHVACLASRLAAAVRGARRGWLSAALEEQQQQEQQRLKKEKQQQKQQPHGKKSSSAKREHRRRPLSDCVELEAWRALEWCAWVCLGEKRGRKS